MKLQLIQINLYERNVPDIKPITEYESLEAAVRQEFFKEGYEVEQYEVDDILAGFVEEDNAFVCSGEELLMYFIKH